MRYGVTTDNDYSAEHKRQLLHVWSGPWFHTFEAQALSRRNGAGFVLTTHNDERIVVDCPSPRTEENYQAVDAAISHSLNEHEALRMARTLAVTAGVLPDEFGRLPRKVREAWLVVARHYLRI